MPNRFLEFAVPAVGPLLRNTDNLDLGYTDRPMSHFSPELENLIRGFVDAVTAAARAQADEQVRAVVAAAFSEVKPGKPAARPTPAEAPSVPGRRKIRLSAEGMAARKLQGQYLGLLRGLRPRPRAQVKKVAQEKGVAAALKFAATLK